MNSLINNQVTCAILIFAYCVVYGLCATRLLSGLPMAFFLCSVIFAMVIFYVKDPDPKKEKKGGGIFVNQTVGTILSIYYIAVFGPTSLSIFKGLELMFFVSSFIFALVIFYSLDSERIKQSSEVVTIISFIEKSISGLISKFIARGSIGITDVQETDIGLLINKLEANGSAKLAGLRGPRITVDEKDPLEHRSIDPSSADLIVSIDEKIVKTFDDFLNYIGSKRPGAIVKVIVLRNGNQLVVPVKLGREACKLKE